MIHQGCRFDVYRMPVVISTEGFEPSPVVGGSALAGFRHLARTIGDAGFLSELVKDPEQAAGHYMSLLPASLLLMRNGVMIESLVGMAVAGIDQRELDRLIASASLEEGTLREIIRVCSDAEVAQNEPAKMWANESAYSNAIIALGDSWSHPHNPMLPRVRTYYPLVADILSKYPLDRLLQRTIVDALYEDELEEFADEKGAGMVSLRGGWLRGMGQHNVRLRETRIRAAIALYERKNGQPPEQLEELVPDILPSVPIDPFSGQPMRYERTETGWKVWSVGENNLDDYGLVGTGYDAARQHVWDSPDYVFESDIPSNLEVRSSRR